MYVKLGDHTQKLDTHYDSQIRRNHNHHRVTHQNALLAARHAKWERVLVA